MVNTILEDRILRSIGKYRVSISEIELDLFEIGRPSRRTIQRVLKLLIHRNLVRQTGVAKGTKYEKVKEA